MLQKIWCSSILGVYAKGFAKAVFMEWVAGDKSDVMHAYEMGYVQIAVAKAVFKSEAFQS